MQRNARTAYNALKRMGCPVLEPSLGWGGHFAISAENNVDEVWADYYDGPYIAGWDFGVNPKIDRVLRANGLYSEWVNPGVLAVYDA